MSTGLIQLRRSGAPSTEAPVAVRPAQASGAPLAYVETYGCQMNVADSELMLGVLQGAGYGRTDDPAAADLILLNTCAVREKAEERVFGRAGTLSALKAARPDVILGITGCMAEHLKEKIQQRAPYVDLVVGPDGYRRLPEHLSRVRGGERVRDTVLDRYETYEGLDPARALAGDSTSATSVIGHVTIQRGCDKFCTFCVVPYTRGRERGTPPREVLRQARALVAAGVREVQLLGQTVNSYRYEDVGFAELLRAVAAVEELPRVRFTSPYPLDFSPEVIRAIAELPEVCKHVHLPLQTGSDPVLARMRRGYDFANFRAAGGRPARGGAGHRHHHRHPGRLLRRDRGGVRRDAAGDGGDPLRQRVHVRLLRARGHLRRPQDARHRARAGQAAPPGRGDRRAAPDHARRSTPPRSAGASRC